MFMYVGIRWELTLVSAVGLILNRRTCALTIEILSHTYYLFQYLWCGITELQALKARPVGLISKYILNFSFWFKLNFFEFCN